MSHSGETVKAKKPEQEIRIRLVLPFLIRLKDGTYKCRMGKNEFLVHLQSIKTVRTRENTKSTKEGIKESRVLAKASTGELTEAIEAKVPGAMLQYSLVTLQFWKSRTIKSDERPEEINKNIALAHRFLNQFINVYRFVTSDIEAYPLNRGELSEVRAGQTLHFWINFPQEGKCVMGSDFGEHGVMPTPKPFGDNEHQRIGQMLVEGVEPPIVDLLLLNSRSFLRDGERRLALIELGAACDIGMEQATLNMLKLRGELSDKIRQTLETASTKRIALEILQPIINEDLINSTPYTTWGASFRELRNRVVHDAYEPTPEEAEVALELVELLHNYLATLTPKM